MSLKNRSFLKLLDYTPEQIDYLLEFKPAEFVEALLS